MKAAHVRQSAKLGAIGLAVTALALGLAACSGGSETAAPVEVVSTPPVAVLTSVAKYQLVLRNAATGALITDSTAVSLSGVNVVGATGAAVTSLTMTNGLASFATAPGVAAGGTLNIATQSRAAGWNDGATAVNVQASPDVQIVTISLLNTLRVAEIPATAPIAAAAASVPVTGGVTGAAISAATPAKTVTGLNGAAATLPAATVNIAAGTRITNAAGQTPTGPLTLTALSPALNTAEGLAQVPNGGQSSNGPVVMKGLIQTLMQDSSGGRFTNFSNPVNIQMPLVAGAKRKGTNTPLVVGDSITISTFNPATNAWSARPSPARVIQGPNGLMAEFETASFSFSGYDEGAYLTCDTTVSFTRPAGNTKAFNYIFIGPTGVINGPVLGTVSTIGPLTIEPSLGSLLSVFDENDNRMGSAVIGRCTNDTIAVNFPAAPPTGSINISTREQCASGSNGRALPNATVAAVSGTKVRSASSGGDGTASIIGLPAGSYTVTPSAVAGRTAPAAQTVTVGTGAVAANFVYTLPCATGTGGG